MKKKVLSLVALVGVCAFAAPTPDFTSMAVLSKATGTGCGPCGSWGWTQMEDAIKTHGSNTLIMGVYDSYYNYNSGGQTALHNDFSMAWEKNISVRWFPDFSVMSTAASSPFTTEIQAQQAKTQNVGMNFVAWVSGSTVKIARYIQSKTALTGTYSVSTILLEDSVMHVQASQTGTVPHHYVFRAMPNTKQRGDTLPAKALSGQLYVDTVSIAIRSGESPAWNKNKFKIGMVLWNGATMQNAYTRPIANTWDTYSSSVSSSSVSSSSVSSSSVVSSSSISSSSSSSGTTVDCSPYASWVSGQSYNWVASKEYVTWTSKLWSHTNWAGGTPGVDAEWKYEGDCAGTSSSSSVSSSSVSSSSISSSSSLGSSSSVVSSSSTQSSSSGTVAVTPMRSAGYQIQAINGIPSLLWEQGAQNDILFVIFNPSGAKIQEFKVFQGELTRSLNLPSAGSYLIQSQENQKVQSHFYNWMP